LVLSFIFSPYSFLFPWSTGGFFFAVPPPSRFVILSLTWRELSLFFDRVRRYFFFFFADGSLLPPPPRACPVAPLNMSTECLRQRSDSTFLFGLESRYRVSACVPSPLFPLGSPFSSPSTTPPTLTPAGTPFWSFQVGRAWQRMAYMLPPFYFSVFFWVLDGPIFMKSPPGRSCRLPIFPFLFLPPSFSPPTLPLPQGEERAGGVKLFQTFLHKCFPFPFSSPASFFPSPVHSG